MKTLIAAVVLLLLFGAASAAELTLPADVQTFTDSREICDHFRGEPVEGDDEAALERRNEVIGKITQHCVGTDKALAALKQKYAQNASISELLSNFEEQIEETPSE